MAAAKSKDVTVTPPSFEVAEFVIIGESPYVQNKFSNKAREQMRETQEAGAKSKSKKTREPKDFQACYEEAKHISTDGWCGIPAPSFRSAMISACRVAGMVMTRAKLSVFVVADGFDKDDGTPLVRITHGEPVYNEMPVRLESGVADIRARPMWMPGWRATVRVRYDSDALSLDNVAALLSRAGLQVGIGEGRNDSKKSNGMGWGEFRLATEEDC